MNLGDKEAKIPTEARVYLLLKEDPTLIREFLSAAKVV